MAPSMCVAPTPRRWTLLRTRGLRRRRLGRFLGLLDNRWNLRRRKRQDHVRRARHRGTGRCWDRRRRRGWKNNRRGPALHVLNTKRGLKLQRRISEARILDDLLIPLPGLLKIALVFGKDAQANPRLAL